MRAHGTSEEVRLRGQIYASWFCLLFHCIEVAGVRIQYDGMALRRLLPPQVGKTQARSRSKHATDSTFFCL